MRQKINKSENGEGDIAKDREDGQREGEVGPGSGGTAKTVAASLKLDVLLLIVTLCLGLTKKKKTCAKKVTVRKPA